MSFDFITNILDKKHLQKNGILMKQVRKPLFYRDILL